MGKEFTVRKANRKDLLRIAEIQVFNYRLYFYPIFLSDEYYFDELSVPSLMQKYESELDSLYVYDDGVVKGFSNQWQLPHFSLQGLFLIAPIRRVES